MSVTRPAAVYLERFPDPLTGWAMVGAGCAWDAVPPPGTVVELRYDGVPRVTCPADAAKVGTQAPLEPHTRRVQVIIRQGEDELLAADDPVATLRHRGAPAGPAAKPVPRWLSPVATVARAGRSGELFRPAWWRARAGRYADFARKGFARVRERHLKRGRFAGRDAYAAFCQATDPTPADLAAMRAAAAGFRSRPTFSVLVPVYNADPRWLAAAIESVRTQVYPHWQLVLADDASTAPATRAALDALPADPRVTVVRRPVNGHIVAASNTAAEHATGDFVALLDHDDALAPHALFRYAELLQTRPDLDLLYSDEDKLSADGRRYDPQFKPGWSPELLLSYNYVNHFTCVRRTAFDAAGRFRPGTDGAQDLDLLLRVTERTDRVAHIPEVLYHWRATPDSTASAAAAKPYVHTAAHKAVADALTRRGVPAAVETPAFAAKLGLPIVALAPLPDGPSVAVIVHGPADRAAITSRAVKSCTNYSSVTTYLVIDDATKADALNRMAAGRTEDILVFLEAGIEPADPDWLGRLVAHLALPGVGVAGGLVRAAGGAIVSAGTLADDPPRHAFARVTPDPVSYYFLAESTRTVSAPGRGCLATRRDTFDRAGGFDADRFPRTLYDLDYARRAAGSGLRTVHVGGAEFLIDSARHRASPDAGVPGGDPDDLARRDAPTERQRLRAGRGTDPYTSPNLSPWGDFAPDPLPAAVRVPPAAGPVRTLFATHNLSGLEGAPAVLRAVALGLHARGDVAATVFAPAPGAGASAFEAAGVPVVAPGRFADRFTDGQWTPAEYAAAQSLLTRTVKHAAPAVVVVNTLGLFPLVEAAARCGAPVVWVVHESYTPARLAAAMSPFARGRCERAFRLAERVVFVSRACADLYRHLDARSTFTVVHNSLDTTAIDGFIALTTREQARELVNARAGAVRLVAVGTVCERKAQHVIVQAAAIAARTRRDFVCSLVGARPGLPYLSYVEHLIKARGVEGVVELVPETPAVRPHYRAADVFVCASHVEAFSLAVLEAMAFGLPVVSTLCGGLDEQVTWGENALAFPFDDADALAGHLLTLLADPALRGRMGREARAGLDLMPGPDAVLDRYARLIRHAAGGTR